MRFVFGDCELDTERHEVRRAGHVVALEPRALRVLACLLRHAGRAVAKQELVQACWPGPSPESISQDYVLRNCVMKIRQAVGDMATPQAMIETVRGYGYRVTAAVTVLPAEACAPGPVSPDPTHGATPSLPSVPAQVLPGRRQLTVLRCRLVEACAWARRDPEEVRTILQALYTTCEAVIQRFDGYIAQYDSAGLVVYFGYPTADEAAAPRAVRAGLLLVDALGRRPVRMVADTPIRLAVRVGIHTGLVVVDTVGASGRQDPVALGDTPQVAARLQALATPDTVVVSDTTWRLVQGYFTGQPLAPQARPGLPVPAYHVLGMTGAQHRLDMVSPRGLTPLVGREAELTLLRARWAQAQDGLGQVVLLSGEAGIGKSRLVQAFHVCLAPEPPVRLEWRCSPDAQQRPLHPVLAHLHRLLRWRPEETPEAALRALEARLAALGVALPETVPLLAALLALPLPAHYLPLALTPQQQRQQTLEALRTWLLAEARQQPVLFIVEDLHWSDPSTLEFLTLLIDQGPTAGLLTLLTCRPEWAVPWGARAHCTTLTLPRLPEAQVAQMIGGVAGDTALPPAVVAHIVAQTDGVPLFVEEVTKMVLESGLLRAPEADAGLTESLPPLAIPATLHDVLMARLDRLGPVKAVAQLGATIGRTFAYALLQAVAALDTTALQQALRQLVEAELLYQRGLPPQATYTFKHALIQDAAYHSLLRSTRQEYHQRIAQVLEAQGADSAETQPALLAHHYTEAGLVAQALPYYRQAGAQAVARSAYREAVALFEQALRVGQQLPDSRNMTTQAIDLRLALRTALRPLGAFERTLVVLHEAETFAAALRDTQRWGQVAVLLAVQFRMMGAYAQGRAAAQRALAVATANGDVVLHALAQQYLGIIYQDQGDYRRAMACLEQTRTAITGVRQRDLCGVDLLPAVLSRASLTACHAERGTFTAGRAVGDEGLRIAEAVAHPSSLMFARWGLGLLALRQGALPRALHWLERAVTSCQETDVPGYFPRVAATLGAAYTLAGRLAEAVPLLTQAWEHTLALDMRGLQTLCGLALAEAQGRAGQMEEASALAEHTLALARAHQERGRQASALHLLGDLTRWRAPVEHAPAAAAYRQALTLAEELGMRPLQAHCHRGLGMLSATIGQHEQARAELSTAIAMYQAMEMTFWLPETEAALRRVDAR